MRRSMTGVLVALLVLLATGCGIVGLEVVGSGYVSEQTYEVKGFDIVSVGHGLDVDVKPGDAYAVSVRTDDNILPHVVVRRSGDRLEISMQPGWYRATDLRAFVTLPKLQGLELSGGASGYVAPGLRSSGVFAASLSGGSEASIGSMDADGLALQLSGASSLSGHIRCGSGHADIGLSGGSQIGELTGDASVLSVSMSSSGPADLEGFAVQSASITLSGGSEARVSVRTSLVVVLSGGSTLEYRKYSNGPSILGLDISGGSSIQSF